MELRTKHRPLVSVVIPAYRVSKYLGEALASVFRQTWGNLEVLVVDQDLDDAMTGVLAPYGNRIRRLKLSPPGVSAARDCAIRHARGEYIAQLDGDDVWEDHAVETLMGVIERESSDVAFGNAVFTGNSRFTGRTFQEIFPAHSPVTYRDVAMRRTTVFVGVLGKKSCFERAGCYDEAFSYGEDFDLWLRMLRNGDRFAFTRQVVYRYRRHAEAACSKPEVERNRSLLKVYDKHLAFADLSETNRAALRTARTWLVSQNNFLEGKQAILSGDYYTAGRLFAMASKQVPNRRLRVIASALKSAPGLVGPLLQRRVARAASGGKNALPAPQEVNRSAAASKEPRARLTPGESLDSAAPR